MKYEMILSFTVLALTGCMATIKDGPTHVHVNDGYYGNGNFCPPGQAKKGNC